MGFYSNNHSFTSGAHKDNIDYPQTSQGGTPDVQAMLDFTRRELELSDSDRVYYGEELLWILAGSRIPPDYESPSDQLQTAQSAMDYYKLPNSDHVRYGAMLATLCRNYAYLCHKKGISLEDSFEMLYRTELLKSDRALSLLTEIAGVYAVLDLASENQTGPYQIEFVGASVYDDMGNEAAEHWGYDIHYNIRLQGGIKHLIYIDMRSQRNNIENRGISLTGNSQLGRVNPTSANNHLELTIESPINQAATVEYLFKARDLVKAALRELHEKLLTNHQDPPLIDLERNTFIQSIVELIKST